MDKLKNSELANWKTGTFCRNVVQNSGSKDYCMNYYCFFFYSICRGTLFLEFGNEHCGKFDSGFFDLAQNNKFDAYVGIEWKIHFGTAQRSTGHSCCLC